MKSVATRSTANLLAHRRKKGTDQVEAGIKVIMRVRPLVQNEVGHESVVKADQQVRNFVHFDFVCSRS